MLFYEEAEKIISHRDRRGSPVILRTDGKFKPYSLSGMQKIVQRMRKEIGLPSYFTLDACRHGGMTELKQTRKRRAHRVANQAAASIQNEAGDVIQNGNGGLRRRN